MIEILPFGSVISLNGSATTLTSNSASVYLTEIR